MLRGVQSKRIIATAVILILLATIVMGGKTEVLQASSLNWSTYNDPEFNLLIDYPSAWTVIPRSDSADSYGSVLRFTPEEHDADEPHGEDSHDQSEVEIVFGLHTIPYETGQTVTEWTEKYMEKSTPFPQSEIEIEERTLLSLPEVTDQQVLQIRGRSPLTPFTLINIPRGDVMWFIWTNDDATTNTILARMLESLRFSDNTPRTLEEAYGPLFQLPTPQPEEQEKFQKIEKPNTIQHNVPVPSSHWYVPIPAGTAYDVLCGSDWHRGTAEYAADVQMPHNTHVHAAYHSWIDFAGWDSTGYGNLIRASSDRRFYTNIYTGWYAHLDRFDVVAGQEVGATQLLAHSGNTGTEGYHLHFHIVMHDQWDHAVDLDGLNTFDTNHLWPSGWGTCGRMHR